jgi:hypothetical protein
MRYIALTILSLIAGVAFAQIEQPRRILEVGVAGGLNMSELDVQPQIRQTSLNGLNSGFFVRYTSEKYFSMICAAQLEVNYSQRGWNEEFDKEVPYSYSRTLNYIEVPFLAHLSWGKEPHGLQFFINLGPQIGVLVSESEEYGGGFDIEQRPETIRPIYGKEAEKRFDYGILGGAGLELKTKIGNFFLEGRYYYGLSDIFGNSKVDDFGRSANKTISVRLGYSIRLL